MKTNGDKIKVLFIAGNGRSGSTILDIILGQIDGFFAVGELRRIWDRGLIENRPCGCETPFRDCHTWNAIFKEAYGGMNAIDPNEMVGYRERLTQTKHLPGMLLRKERIQNKNESLQNFLAALDKLYGAIHEITNCSVIVDASKWPMYGYLLHLLPRLELYIVHLVRDPRAVAFSWTRQKQYDPGKFHPKQSAFKSTFYWVTWNPAIDHLWKQPPARYMFLPYEQFINHPQDSIAQIVQLVGEGQKKLPFIDTNTVELSKTHAVAGNVARLTTGPVKLRMDDEWKQKLPWSSRLLVSMLTWPWLYKYGYASQN